MTTSPISYCAFDATPLPLFLCKRFTLAGQHHACLVLRCSHLTDYVVRGTHAVNFLKPIYERYLLWYIPIHSVHLSFKAPVIFFSAKIYLHLDCRDFVFCNRSLFPVVEMDSGIIHMRNKVLLVGCFSFSAGIFMFFFGPPPRSQGFTSVSPSASAWPFPFLNKLPPRAQHVAGTKQRDIYGLCKASKIEFRFASCKIHLNFKEKKP